jgi:hypothetical protein
MENPRDFALNLMVTQMQVPSLILKGIERVSFAHATVPGKQLSLSIKHHRGFLGKTWMITNIVGYQ